MEREAPAPSLAAAVSPAREYLELGLVVAGWLMLLFVQPHEITGDAAIRYETLVVLVENGRLSAREFSILQPILAIPLYLAGKVVGDPPGGVSLFNALVLVGGSIGTYFLLRRHLDRHVLRRFLLLLAAASMFPAHVRNFYGEVMTAIGAMLAAIFYSRGRTIAGAASAVLAVVNTPAAAVGQLLADAWRAVAGRRYLRPFVPLAIATGLVMLEFQLRRGSPFKSGYEGFHGFKTVLPYSGLEGFSYPFLLGLLAQVFSFGKGILFFAPGLVLCFAAASAPLGAEGRALQRSALWFTLGLLVVYSKWWSWYGGWYWGPRFLLFACVPASLALAQHLTFPSGRLAVRWLALGALALSSWVAVSGGVFDQANMGLCIERGYQLEHLCWYVPEFSALVRPFIVGEWPTDRRTIALGGYFAVAFAALAVPYARVLVVDSTRAAIAALRRSP